MPTYEYLCQACGTRFEVWQKMSDDALTTCQACGGPVRRVFYPAGIVFKGGGFYSTDHRASGAPATNGAASTEGAPAAAAGESNADAKGAATPAAPSSGSNSSGSKSGGSPSSTPTAGS